MRKWGLLIVLLGALTGLIFQASFGHFLMVLIAGEFGLLPLLIYLAIRSIIAAFRPKKSASDLRNAWLVFGLVALSLGMSWAVGSATSAVRTHVTRVQIASTMQRLDRIKQGTGRFPSALPFISPSGLEAWLAYPAAYSTNGNDFDFRYEDPCGMMDSYRLNSSDRAWHHHGD